MRIAVDGGLHCVAAGVPVLVEKPLADSVEAAERLVEAGEIAGVPVLTGHHRNYSPIMTKSRDINRGGALGKIVVVVGSALFHKHDEYFEVGDGWHRKPGGGPILGNMTHEVNSLLFLIGPIVRVQATSSDATRGHPVEDTAVITFTFANGALGTFAVSDTAASARSWEQTSREDEQYAADDEDCYHIAGTNGSLSIPTMRLKVFAGKKSWYERFDECTVDVDRTNPLARQIAHFATVVREHATPVCSGRDGLNTLRVVDAVIRATRTGLTVEPSSSVRRPTPSRPPEPYVVTSQR